MAGDILQKDSHANPFRFLSCGVLHVDAHLLFLEPWKIEHVSILFRLFLRQSRIITWKMFLVTGDRIGGDFVLEDKISIDDN